jgi:hypothetical protein
LYAAQLKLLPGKKIELILEPTDQKCEGGLIFEADRCHE